MQNTGSVTSALKRMIACISSLLDDGIAEKMRKFWTEGEIVEILAVVSLFDFLNRWNDSRGTEMEKGVIESGEKYLEDQE